MSMKNILSYMPKKLAAALVVATVALGIATAAIAGFGPGRETRAWTPAENGFDHVTFNSFTGVPNGIGDERDFLRGVQVGRDATWIDPVNSVNQDAEIEARIYIHNNADPALNDAPGNPGVAKNVTVKVELPNGISQTQEVKALIGASNAVPTSIFDTLDLTGEGGKVFELAYIPGSAKLHEGASISALSDNLVTSGVGLADQKGCFEFVREITFRLKVKMPRYTVKKTVRLDTQSTSSYAESVQAQNGNTAVWKVEFTNTGTTALNAVKFTDPIPAGSTFVPGSIKVFNMTNPSGYSVPDTALQMNGTQLEINLGDYQPTANAFIYFKTKLSLSENDRCAGKDVKNIAYVRPEGFGTIQDDAKVTFNRDNCTNPENPVYSCNAVSITNLGGRKIRVDVSKTASPANRVSVKNYEYNFGDGTTALVTDKNPVEYTFAKDGTFKVSVKVSFTVDGQTKTSTDICEAVVTFTTPGQIPNTGAGSMIGTLTAISIVGMLFHRAWTLRRTQ